MANIESNTLLEKLNVINDTKNRIRQVLINCGGKDYINEDTAFIYFPEVILRLYADIKSTAILLEYIINGGVLEEIINSDIPTYNDISEYTDKLAECRRKLIDNLRTQNVLVDDSESFESLINKVLEIKVNPDTQEAIDNYINRMTDEEY